MFSRASTAAARMGVRFQSQAAKEQPFNNKHNFNINPPPVHAYWNLRNALVLFAFVPAYIAVGYLGKSVGEGLDGFTGLEAFARLEQSPMKEIPFGLPQK